MTQIDKLKLLLKSSQILFHTQDLAILWGIENKNTLYTTIKRYVKNGALTSIVKGLYSKIPTNQIDKYALGTALIHKYCYISCETVLSKEGIINQEIIPVTFVSSISTKIEFEGTLFIYRKLKPEKLFDSRGINKMNGYFIANKDRAISDMLYFNPKYYLDNKNDDHE